MIDSYQNAAHFSKYVRVIRQGNSLLQRKINNCQFVVSSFSFSGLDFIWRKCLKKYVVIDPYEHKANDIDFDVINVLLKFSHVLKCFHYAKLTGN